MMMRLSTMWLIDRQLRPDWTSPLATALAEPWSPDAEPVFVRSSANVVFVFRSRGEVRYLRFRPVAEQRGRDTTTELAFMARCAAHGLRVPAPVPAESGDDVHRSVVQGRSFDAVALTALAGEEREVADLDVASAEAWGALVARVQEVGRELELPATPRPQSSTRRWQPGSDSADAELAQQPAEVRRESEELQAVMDMWPRTPAAYGLVHGDVELDNLRWQGGHIGVLDFDACQHQWYGVDVAAAADDLRDRPDLEAAFLDGYEAAGGAQLRDRLDACRRWVDLQTYLSVARAIDLTLDGSHPAWLHDLGQRLRLRQQSYLDRLGEPRTA